MSLLASKANSTAGREEALNVAWALISPELYDLLASRRGCSLDAY